MNAFDDLIKSGMDALNADRLTKSEKALTRALEIADSSDEKFEALRALLNLAGKYLKTKNYTQPASLYAYIENAEADERIKVLEWLASLYKQLDDLEGAERIYIDIYELRVNIMGANHPDTMGVLQTAAMLVQMQGRSPEELYARAYEVARASANASASVSTIARESGPTSESATAEQSAHLEAGIASDAEKTISKFGSIAETDSSLGSEKKVHIATKAANTSTNVKAEAKEQAISKADTSTNIKDEAKERGVCKADTNTNVRDLSTHENLEAPAASSKNEGSAFVKLGAELAARGEELAKQGALLAKAGLEIVRHKNESYELIADAKQLTDGAIKGLAEAAAQNELAKESLAKAKILGLEFGIENQGDFSADNIATGAPATNPWGKSSNKTTSTRLGTPARYYGSTEEKIRSRNAKNAQSRQAFDEAFDNLENKVTEAKSADKQAAEKSAEPKIDARSADLKSAEGSTSSHSKDTSKSTGKHKASNPGIEDIRTTYSSLKTTTSSALSLIDELLKGTNAVEQEPDPKDPDNHPELGTETLLLEEGWQQLVDYWETFFADFNKRHSKLSKTSLPDEQRELHKLIKELSVQALPLIKQIDFRYAFESSKENDEIDKLDWEIISELKAVYTAWDGADDSSPLELSCTYGWLRRCIALGPLHQDTLRNLFRLGLFYSEQHRFHSHNPTLSLHALRLVRTAADKHPRFSIVDRIRNARMMADCLLQEGKAQDALGLYNLAYRAAKSCDDLTPEEMVNLLFNLAMCHNRLENYQPCAELLERIRKIHEAMSRNSEQLIWTILHLLACYRKMANTEEETACKQRILLEIDWMEEANAMRVFAAHVCEELQLMDIAEQLCKDVLANAQDDKTPRALKILLRVLEKTGRKAEATKLKVAFSGATYET